MHNIWAAEQLKKGLDEKCADDIREVLCNLGDGTCDAVELIPLLRQVAEKNRFYYFDDNGAGGFPHPSGDPVDFRDRALRAIENIQENKALESSSDIARSLKCLDTKIIESALNQLLNSNCKDETLIPILEKIVKKDKYESYSYYFGSSYSRLGETAQRAIQQIRRNIEGETGRA